MRSQFGYSRLSICAKLSTSSYNLLYTLSVDSSTDLIIKKWLLMLRWELLAKQGRQEVLTIKDPSVGVQYKFISPSAAGRARRAGVTAAIGGKH